MAGTDPRFPAGKFRDAIQFAMNMGFPGDTQQQLTWRWTTTRQFSKEDSGGLPFEWKADQVVGSTVVTDMIVPCAVSFKPPTGATRVGGTALGIMDIASATVTLLDVDRNDLFAHGGDVLPDQVVMDGNIYVVQIWGPPYGLFDVTLYDIYIQAIDES